MYRNTVFAAFLLTYAVALSAQQLRQEQAEPRSAATRAEVVANIAEVLRERYNDETLAKKLAADLQANSATLSAENSTPPEFARTLTKAMQASVSDLHLYVTYEPERVFAPGAANDTAARAADSNGQVRQVVRTGRIDGRAPRQLARTNYAFDAADRLDGNIGYLKLSRFVPLGFSKATATAATEFIANSDAVIIALRGNIGGAPDAVAFLMSRFLDPASPALIHSAVNRVRGVNERIMSDPAVAHAQLRQTPLYILIDRNTASAAEMFAYGAQRLGRATIVGETSSGAANGGTRLSVGMGFALFVPEWKVTNGAGWEGTGVKPDVETKAAEALTAARRLALERLIKDGAQTAEEKADRERALSKL